jgi:hypothetical protein
MADASENGEDRQAQERVEKCIEAMFASTRHKRLAQELVKFLEDKGDESKAKSSAGRTIDI